jgi:hypothetical protein
MTKTVQTTAELHPQIGTLTADNPNPTVGQTVTFTATEPVAGDRATWTWQITNVDTGAVVDGPAAGQPRAPHSFAFRDPGQYRVRLTVSYDGATDEKDLDITVAALFNLTVNIAGQGSGSVSGAGLSCTGKICTGRYRAGTNVDLTASPGSRSEFGGWTSCTRTSPGGACMVTMDGDKSVTATFNVQPDRTPPNPTLTGGGQTVFIGSGSRQVTRSGSAKTLQVTATATDAESAVTNIEIWTSATWFCSNGSGIGQRSQEDPGGPAATVNGATVTFTVNLSRGCAAGFHLDEVRIGV